MIVILIAFYLALIAEVVTGNAILMMNACGTKLTTGTQIMGGGATESSTFLITVKRSSQALTSSSSYQPGETLTISFTGASSNEYVIDTSKGTFSGNHVGCSNKRFYDSTYNPTVSISLILPPQGSGDVSIVAGWAGGQYPISLTTPFILKEAVLVVAPNTPTVTPTSAPKISIAVSQNIDNVDVASMQTSDAQNSFKVAVVNTLGPSFGVIVSDVTITTIIDIASLNSIRNLATAGSTVKYSIAIIAKLSSSASSTLTERVKDGTFQTNIRAAATAGSPLQSAVVAASPAVSGVLTIAPTSAPIFDNDDSAATENKNMAITVGVVGGSILLCFILTVIYQRFNYYGDSGSLPK